MRANHPPHQETLNRDIWRLLENAPDMVYRYRFSPSPAVEYATGAVKAITGYAPAEFYADPGLAAKAVHPDDRHLLVQRPVQSEALWRTATTMRWVHPDGRVVWAEHRRVPIRDAKGKLVAIEGIARDITDLVEAQRQLRTSQDQLRRLAASIQTAREEERATLARELHDELGQTLTALKLELARTVNVLKESSVNTETMNRLQALVGLIDIGVTMVKRIATNLRPPTLDHLGLAEAIRWEAAAFSARSGVRCQVVAEAEGTSLSLAQQIALFRIFQEALTNVVRHAHASAVRVRLSKGHGTFELRVSDNGRGITGTEAAATQSIGILGMRERAAQAGATMGIAGRRGKGTMVTVRVPVAARARRAKNKGRTARGDK
jgi:PAS domain S-box-containing protein